MLEVHPVKLAQQAQEPVSLRLAPDVVDLEERSELREGDRPWRPHAADRSAAAQGVEDVKVVGKLRRELGPALQRLRGVSGLGDLEQGLVLRAPLELPLERLAQTFPTSSSTSTRKASKSSLHFTTKMRKSLICNSISAFACE